jgi:large subunit ribosomal protein L21
VYAIVRTGGKQYRVETGDTIYLESLSAAVGEKVTLGEVLLVGGGEKGEARLGSPLVDKAASSCTRSASITVARRGTGRPTPP